MDLLEIHKRLEFLINKAQGVFYSPEEIDSLLDTGQMSVFNDYHILFQKSQRISDALAPFKKQFTFTYGTTPSGVVTTPTDYFDTTEIYTIVQDNGEIKQRPCPRLNENEIVGRLNSQIFKPTILDPVCVTIQNWNIQLYPQQSQAGIMFYLCRPPLPKFVYTASGRVITYDQNASTQMSWADKNIYEILLKCLQMVGINSREQDIQAWSNQEDQQNVLTPNKA